MIITSSAEKFYETYEKYYLTKYNINNSGSNYLYVFYCSDSNDIYCLEGSSMEEIYYKILFKIDYNSCDDIYVYEYPLEILENPIELLKNHYFDNEYYIFEEVKFITSNINNINNINNKVSINNIINLDSSEQFYKTYGQYYYNKILKNITKGNLIKYVLICKESGNLHFVEGYSIEEIYYIIMFQIDSECWDNIYDSEYSLKELKNPIKLFKTHYLESNDYIFEKINIV